MTHMNPLGEPSIPKIDEQNPSKTSCETLQSFGQYLTYPFGDPPKREFSAAKTGWVTDGHSIFEGFTVTAKT